MIVGIKVVEVVAKIRHDIIGAFKTSDVRVRSYQPNVHGTVLRDLPVGVAERVLLEGISVVEQVGYKYWVSAGTALGLHRDKRLIGHDTDLDIEVYARWGVFTRVEEVELQNRMADAGFTLKRTQRYKTKLQQLAYVKEGVIFDIYFFYDGIDGLDFVNFCEHGVYRFRKKFYPPRKTGTVLGDLMMPCFIDEYLSRRYGDWKTPTTKKVDWMEECKCLDVQ